MAIADETATDADLIRWREDGLEFVQLRAKTLKAGTLLELAQKWKALLAGTRTRLLINARADIARAAGVDGVHLTARGGELTAEQVRKVMSGAFVSVSTHTLTEVHKAREEGVDLIIFGPVFEKRVQGQVVVPGCGVAMLAEACQAAGHIPVLALGGVTEENKVDCLRVGAKGIAAIRLFAQ